MKIPAKIIKFLDSKKIKYKIVEHKTVYTAYDKAATLKVKPNVIGKTLVLKASPSTSSGQAAGLVLVLIPGNKNLDLVKIKTPTPKGRGSEADVRVGSPIGRRSRNVGEAKKVGFVSEKVLKNKFKGVKLGAIPPFGEIWKLQMFIDRGLMKEKNIFVSSGSYEASFKLSPRVFEKLGATLGNFSKTR